ncbi:tkt, partial [Symbiodinium sp. CCMP2592]
AGGEAVDRAIKAINTMRNGLGFGGRPDAAPARSQVTVLIMDYNLASANRATRSQVDINESLHNKGWAELMKIGPDYDGHPDGNYGCSHVAETLQNALDSIKVMSEERDALIEEYINGLTTGLFVTYEAEADEDFFTTSAPSDGQQEEVGATPPMPPPTREGQQPEEETEVTRDPVSELHEAVKSRLYAHLEELRGGQIQVNARTLTICVNCGSALHTIEECDIHQERRDTLMSLLNHMRAVVHVYPMQVRERFDNPKILDKEVHNRGGTDLVCGVDLKDIGLRSNRVDYLNLDMVGVLMVQNLSDNSAEVIGFLIDHNIQVPARMVDKVVTSKHEREKNPNSRKNAMKHITHANFVEPGQQSVMDRPLTEEERARAESAAMPPRNPRSDQYAQRWNRPGHPQNANEAAEILTGKGERGRGHPYSQQEREDQTYRNRTWYRDHRYG